MTCSCRLLAQLSSLSDYDETVCQGRRICVCTSLSLSGSCCPAICLCSSLAPVSVYLLDLGLQYNWNCWQEHNLGCIFLYRNYPNLDIFLPSLWIMYEAWWHWHWWLVSTTLVPSSPHQGTQMRLVQANGDTRQHWGQSLTPTGPVLLVLLPTGGLARSRDLACWSPWSQKVSVYILRYAAATQPLPLHKEKVH